MSFLEFIVLLAVAFAGLAAFTTVAQALAEKAKEEIKMAKTNGRVAYLVTTTRWLVALVFLLYACSGILN